MAVRPATSSSTRGIGIIPAARVRLFGERDAVSEQLREIARQGTQMARVAHACAFVMLVLFSAGSLVGITSESMTAFLAAWRHGQLDLIHCIAAGVSAALVICMDVASLYAALMLRILAARRAPWRKRWIHIGAIALADVLEAGSIAYMTWRYDTPVVGVVWALVIGRDLLAPLYAVYLSLAQALPVGARDVLHVVEMGAGAGMARDAIQLANDPAAPLDHKARLFAAASETTEQDLERLQRLFVALAADVSPAGADGVPAPQGPHLLPRGEPRSAQRPRHQSRPRRVAPSQSHGRDVDDGDVEEGGPTPLAGLPDDTRSNVRTPPRPRGNAVPLSRGDVSPRADTGMSQELRLELSALRNEVARQILATEPTISVREFARRIQLATGNRISESTAQSLLSRVRAEQWKGAEADGDQPPTMPEALPEALGE